MSNRKNTASGVTGDSATTQDNMNLLYTAHQVHTLAQLVYRQMAGGWQGQAPWAAPAARAGFPAAGPMIAGSAATLPSGPPALFYWYP